MCPGIEGVAELGVARQGFQLVGIGQETHVAVVGIAGQPRTAGFKAARDFCSSGDDCSRGEDTGALPQVKQKIKQERPGSIQAGRVVFFMAVANTLFGHRVEAVRPSQQWPSQRTPLLSSKIQLI